MKATTLIASLFPPDWKARRELLECASRADLQYGEGSLAVLLFGISEHRSNGNLPTDGNYRELVLAIGELCGGVRAEARHRPAEATSGS